MQEKINGEVLADITMALHEYLGYTTHDQESCKLTMESEQTVWNYKLRVQRELPIRKF